MSGLPYQLPKSTAQKVTHLSKITSIPMNLLQGAGETEIEAMSVIRNVKNRALMGHI